MGGRAWEWQAGKGAGVALWRVAALEFPGVHAVFSARLGGCSPPPWEGLNLSPAVGDDPARVQENRLRFARAAEFGLEAVAGAQQVHGAAVAVVDRPGSAGPVDGLCTDRPGVVLTIAAADCVVVYLADSGGRAVGLCHAGWRGTAADVAGRSVRAMTASFGIHPGDLVAAISPAIGPCCYEVDGPVIRAMVESASWAGDVLRIRPGGHALLDLWAANRRRLLDAGVPAASIHVAGICTACHPDRLYSHRRDGGRTGRMQGALWLAEREG